MSPLALTTFEEFLLHEDRPAYPWSVISRFRFEGRLDQSSLAKALCEAVARHPLMASTIEQRGKAWYWVPAPSPPVLTWSEAEKDLSSDDWPRHTSIDLRKEAGFRCDVTVGPRYSDVALLFHHACCDGAGYFSFINDLLVCYALARGEDSQRVKLPELDLNWLKQRGTYGLSWTKLLQMMPKQMVGLQGAWQFMRRQPMPLMPHVPRRDDDPTPEEYPAGIEHRFSVEETREFRNVAQKNGVSINELLVRDLFLAIIEWRREFQFGSDQDWLRMMIPMNMRPRDSGDLTAANVVSSIFLDRRGQDAADANKLLQSIHDEMEIIKRNELGHTFLFSLAAFRRLPGGLRKQTRSDRCTISCIFSNVGRVLTQSPLPRREGRLIVGDVELESLNVFVPLRPFNCMSFLAHQYADRLTMGFHYDPQFLIRSQAQRLMEFYLDKSRETLHMEKSIPRLDREEWIEKSNNRANEA